MNRRVQESCIVMIFSYTVTCPSGNRWITMGGSAMIVTYQMVTTCSVLMERKTNDAWWCQVVERSSSHLHKAMSIFVSRWSIDQLRWYDCIYKSHCTNCDHGWVYMEAMRCCMDIAFVSLSSVVGKKCYQFQSGGRCPNYIIKKVTWSMFNSELWCCHPNVRYNR